MSNPSNGTVTYNASTQTVSFVPTAGYTGTASFTYSITDGQGTRVGQRGTYWSTTRRLRSLFSPSFDAEHRNSE